MPPTIFLNFKRFDISPSHGGVNRLAPSAHWGSALGSTLSDLLYPHSEDTRFVAFLPEAHLIGAIQAANADVISFGSQSVHWADTEVGGNFGAFTTQRTANAMKDIGCVWTMIGHSEERRDLARLLSLGGLTGKESFGALHRILNEKVLAAQKAGLRVLYCIGENADEVEARTSLLRNQIEAGLAGVDESMVTLAYEPIWAIGPGKIPPTACEIAAIAKEVKSFTRLELVYGGGLKEDNAQAIGSIDSLDGGLVALTRFSGEIGFYPDEFVTIVENYTRGRSIS